MRSKKGASAFSLIGSAILMLILLILLVFIFRDSITKWFHNIQSCAAQGGECDLAGAPGREMVGLGPWEDCDKQKPKDSPVQYSCYKRQQWEGGGGIPIQSDEDALDGANLRMARYSGDYSEYAGKAFVKATFAKSEDIVERSSIGEGSKVSTPQVKVYVGRLYAFYGLILNGKDTPYCSLYIRTGGRHRGSANILSSAVSKSRCDDQTKWSSPLYYVPKAGDDKNKLEIVMLKKTGEGDGSYREGIVAELQVVDTPDLSYATFGGQKTDVKGLTDIAYAADNAKPFSIILDSDKGTIEMKGITIPKDAKDLDFNFDKNIRFQENEVVIDGNALSWINSGRVLKVTLKRPTVKGPPNPILTYDDGTDEVAREWKRKTCDSPTCEGVSFSADNSVSFMADVAGKTMTFRLYPGSCAGLEPGLCASYASHAAGLNCYERDGKCVKCDITSCRGYAEWESCNVNSCGIQDRPDACTWMKRSFIFDFIVSDRCDACSRVVSCANYNTQESCLDDACRVGGSGSYTSCVWNGKKCVDSRLA